MSEALGDGEGTADLREHRDVRRGAQRMNVYKHLWIPSDGTEPDRTERGDDVATDEANEEWAYVEEQQVLEQAKEESQNWCVHWMHDGRQVGCRQELRDGERNEGRILEELCTSSMLASRRGRW